VFPLAIGPKICEFFEITLKMENINNNSPVRKIFLISWGLTIFFIIIKYTFNLEVNFIGFFSLEKLIKILISFLFIIGSFLSYKHYNKR